MISPMNIGLIKGHINQLKIAAQHKGDDIEKTVYLYNSVGLEWRNMSYFASWVYEVYKKSYLPGVDPSYIDTLSVDKTKMSIFSILIDDLSDNIKLRDGDLLRQALRIPYNETQMLENEYLEATRKVWLEIIDSMKKYPRYDEFKDIFFFDLDQFLNAVKYGYLVNTRDLYNNMETKSYSPHNMMIILFLDMDLMCSPNFKSEELRKVRPIFNYVQDIMHVGNIINTFPREIEELDFSSPMISLGLEEGIITKEDVMKDPKKTLENLQYLIPCYKHRVEEDLQHIRDLKNTVESINIEEFYLKVSKAWEAFLERPQYWKLDKTEEKENKDSLIKSIIGVIPKTSIQWVRM